MRITVATATPIVFFFSIAPPLLLDGGNGGESSMSDQRQRKEEQEAWRRTHGGGSCSGSGAPFSGHHRSHHGQQLLLLMMMTFRMQTSSLLLLCNTSQLQNLHVRFECSFSSSHSCCCYQSLPNASTASSSGLAADFLLAKTNYRQPHYKQPMLPNLCFCAVALSLSCTNNQELNAKPISRTQQQCCRCRQSELSTLVNAESLHMGLISLRQKQEGNAMQQTHKRSWSFTKPFSGLQALLSSSSSSSTGLSV